MKERMPEMPGESPFWKNMRPHVIEAHVVEDGVQYTAHTADGGVSTVVYSSRTDGGEHMLDVMEAVSQHNAAHFVQDSGSFGLDGEAAAYVEQRVADAHAALPDELKP